MFIDEPKFGQGRQRRQRLYGVPPKESMSARRPLRRRRRKGGDVIMEATQSHNTARRFPLQSEHEAQRGRHGEGSNCTGKEGYSKTLKFPSEDHLQLRYGEKVHDFHFAGEEVRCRERCRGGRGNVRFTSSTHQAPREHEDGKPGEEFTLRWS